MSQLKVIKLINGDEIIGYIDDGAIKDRQDDDGEDYSVSNLIFIKGAMRVIQEYDRKSRGHSMFLIDWMPSAKSNVLPIPKDKIITMDSPQDAVEDHYLELKMGEMDEEQEDSEAMTDEELQKQAHLEILKKTNFDDDDMN